MTVVDFCRSLTPQCALFRVELSNFGFYFNLSLRGLIVSFWQWVFMDSVLILVLSRVSVLSCLDTWSSDVSGGISTLVGTIMGVLIGQHA